VISRYSETQHSQRRDGPGAEPPAGAIRTASDAAMTREVKCKSVHPSLYRTEEMGKVKFIAFWEFDVKDFERVIQKRQARIDSGWERRFPETFRLVFPAHLIGWGREGSRSSRRTTKRGSSSSSRTTSPK